MKFNYAEFNLFVKDTLSSFYNKTLKLVSKEVTLNNLLKKSNPYLNQVRGFSKASEIVKHAVDAHLNSSEESKFGLVLEEIVIQAAKFEFETFKGELVDKKKKISKFMIDNKELLIKGIDIILRKQDKIYLVQIKSGPNWANKSQREQLITYFNNAISLMSEEGFDTNNLFCVNGCCYGNERVEYINHIMICGEEFWEFITGIPDFYLKVIDHSQIKFKNIQDTPEYNNLLNKLTTKFGSKYCASDGSINWEELLKISSGKRIVKTKNS